MDTPTPLECHPYYRGSNYDHLKRMLFDDLRPTNVKFPVSHRPNPTIEVDTTISLQRLVLTKRKVLGLAPFVGKPFVYIWYVATDQYGRSIASDSHIHYIDEVAYRMNIRY